MEESQEVLGATEATHAAQHARARMLEGQVEVGSHTGGARDDIDQARPHLRGLQVVDAQPQNPRHTGQGRQEALEHADVAEVLAVGRGVLAHQHDLAHACVGEVGDLSHDLLRASTHKGAAEGRDRAEGAAAIAAGGELHRHDRSGHRALQSRMTGRRLRTGPLSRGQRE